MVAVRSEADILEATGEYGYVLLRRRRETAIWAIGHNVSCVMKVCFILGSDDLGRMRLAVKQRTSSVRKRKCSIIEDEYGSKTFSGIPVFILLLDWTSLK